MKAFLAGAVDVKSVAKIFLASQLQSFGHSRMKASKAGDKLSPADYMDILPSSEEDLTKMCLWEYSREYGALREAIASLKSSVSSYLGNPPASEVVAAAVFYISKGCCPQPGRVGDGKTMIEFMERIEPTIQWIEQLLGRFDWHFLLSAKFPSYDYMSAKSACPIVASASAYRPAKRPLTEYVEREKKHGKKTRRYKVDVGSGIFSAKYELINATDNSEVFSELNADIADEISRYRTDAPKSIHVFMIPDHVYRIHDSEEIASALRSEVLKLTQRKIQAVSEAQKKFTRDNASSYLRWLGAVRYSTLAKDEKEKLALRLRADETTEKDNCAHLVGKEHRKNVELGIAFFKKFFKISDSCKPLVLSL